MTEDLLKEYIRSSWQLLQDHPQAGRYFHELTNRDNSPVVVPPPHQSAYLCPQRIRESLLKRCGTADR